MSAACAFLAAAAILAAAGCGSSGGTGGAAGPEAPEERIVGTWRGDFERTWAGSREEFLRVPMRDEAEYPADPAEREQAILDETREWVSDLTMRFDPDGTYFSSMMGRESTGRYEVAQATQNYINITVDVNGMLRGYRFDFISPDAVNMTNRESNVSHIIVLQREE